MSTGEIAPRLAVREPLLGRLAALGLFAFWAWYVLTTRGVDGDYAWHLLAGRLMLAGHPVFTADPFSWSAPGKPWVDHEWFSEILLAASDRAGGLALVKL
ncbi:MAG: hypothetical protein KGR26_07760, partial [Cyanobacteria bacterium REEB65]|nr:hypothetical protein [Cyanobacteria bacterium REEB65]